MDRVVETSQDPRKEWATPELKKIDIEQITANGPAPTGDSLNSGS
jgi:hypothetical protein